MGESHTTTKFKIRDLPGLLAQTYKNWIAENPWRLGAVVAYYAVLALPGLLVIIINFVGAIWGVEIVQGELINEISQNIGPDTGEAIEEMVKETQQQDKNLISTILGIAILIYGATGVFYQLQLSLNKIWKIPETSGPGFLKMLTDRARGFAFILALGFLMLISFIITAAISVLNNYLHNLFPDLVIYIAYILDFIFSIGIITVLFALIFKYLPDARIRWKTVWKGAFLTALLFFQENSSWGCILGKPIREQHMGRREP